MRISLRLSVVAIVATINVAVFGAGLAFLSGLISDQRQEVQEAYSRLLAERLQQLLDSQGNLKASGILRWTYWSRFEDAMIVHLPDLDSAADRSQPPDTRGVFLNPVGASHRTADFPVDRILYDLERASLEGREIPSAGGIAVPVLLPAGYVAGSLRDPGDGRGGRSWGGCWIRPKWDWTTGALLRQLLPWFVISTLLLTLGTFVGLSRLVLDPVRDLADAANSIAAGDLARRAQEPGRHDEVAELVRGFNAMADHVQGSEQRLVDEVERATAQAREAEAAAMTQRRLAATGELAAGIAHEINNPLGGMLNAVEVLQREETAPEKRARYHELLQHGLERVRDTVGRLLRLAPRETHTAPVDLTGPLGDALGLVRHRAGKLGVRLALRHLRDGRSAEYDVSDELPATPRTSAVLGEANELGQAILNLLVNALDALEEKDGERSVVIELEEQGGEVRLAVQDDGPGMDPALLPRAEDLFFTTKEAGRGTGLGLAIVHNVVTSHGGRVRITSRPGEGFRVELWLPTVGGPAGGAA